MNRSPCLSIWMAVLAALVLIGGMASSAWAATIWMDDFERADSNTVGNGWGEIGKKANSVRIINNSLQLRNSQKNAPPSAAAIQKVSTTGYTNITLMYDWAPHASSDKTDKLYVDWKLPESTWTKLSEHTLEGAQLFSSYTVSLPGAEYQPAIQFRFWTEKHGKGANEGAYIDDVKLTGYRIPTIPEPGTLLLIGSGLAGLGVGTRRRILRK